MGTTQAIILAAGIIVAALTMSLFDRYAISDIGGTAGGLYRLDKVTGDVRYCAQYPGIDSCPAPKQD